MARLRAAGCVFAEDEADLLLSSATSPAALRAMVDRRAGGEPLEHVLGWVRFCGIRMAVAPGVFIPRARTALLVREAVAILDRHGGRCVVDLCCGSGAIGAAIATTAGARVEPRAADIDPASVACARRNLRPWGSLVYEGDLFGPLPAGLRGRIDLLVANVPYVPTGEIDLLPREARLYEPRLALDGGADGLNLLRRIAGGAPDWLAPRGHLLVETSRQQAPTATGILHRAGLTARIARDEDLDATVVTGYRTGRVSPPGPRDESLDARS